MYSEPKYFIIAYVYLEDNMDSKKILNSVKLPTLSKTLYEIIELEKTNPITFLKDVKAIIEKDPLLSAHILKVANSPLYGFSQKIRTVSHAIGLLGIRKIRTIAFTFSIFDFFKRVDYKEEYGKTFNLILKKSLLISSISTILANKTDQVNSDELYVAGLLADIGQLILFLHNPSKYSEIYSCLDKNLVPREKEIFQLDHIELAVDFCSHWNFPSFIESGIKNHSVLKSDCGLCKIAFISNQITELLLTEEEEERKTIFKEVENHTKRLLHLSLSEVEETIKTLPYIMETFINDFPELQKDLNKIIKTGSSLIIDLMKREMDMVILAKELTESQKTMGREKIFLSHMLNLSYFFSSLVSPEKVMASLFEYFENFITEFSIEFIYKNQGDSFILVTGKDSKGTQIQINDFPNLLKARISNEVVRLETDEMEQLDKDSALITLIFPISYHNNFFGFLLLNVAKENYLAFDLEMSYVQILANIIANSFQNYLSFQGMRNETNKKEWVTRELFKFDKELDQSKKTMLKLQKSEIVGEMLPVIFHKLKNKLTPILGYSQILLTKVEDDRLKQRISKIEKNANELTDQLNFLRDYFKIDKQVKDKENLNGIINQLKPYFEQIEAVEGIEIELDLDPSVPDDTLIPGQIEALITHLVDNAVQSIKVKESGESRGQITIGTQVDEEEGNGVYTLSVRDNGIGIDEKEVPIIWTPFYSQFPGRAGLGLSICEKIISNHEASHLVESVEGEYTEFMVTFTSKIKPLEPEEESVPVIESPKEKVQAKILIVDDEAYLVDLMKEILLNEADFDIVTTTSGSEALELVDSSFDLVISDVRMPEVNGMDLYNYLCTKKMEKKMFMVTADPFSDDVWTFLNENKVDFLKKPFELMDFKKRVLDKLS